MLILLQKYLQSIFALQEIHESMWFMGKKPHGLKIRQHIYTLVPFLHKLLKEPSSNHLILL